MNPPASRGSGQTHGLALLLFVLTLLSMLYVGCMWEGVDPWAEGPGSLWRGYTFALPLMAILLSHELGHYVAARLHGVEVSPPYFIPMPFALIGTFGAVIRMRGPVEGRAALLDIGAAGPIAGFVVTIPVLVYGVLRSPVQALDPAQHYLVEGHSLFYSALIYLLKGPLAAGHDIVLTPTALAGWAGLLVTMMNLVPVGQLDGGHVAYALFGPRQDRHSRHVLHALLALSVLIGAGSAWPAVQQRAGFEAILAAAAPGLQWGLWWLLLRQMARAHHGRHPPTLPGELSRARRLVGWVTLSLFPLLFMPVWLRQG